MHAGRVQHRAGSADEHMVALVGQGRRFAGVIIADHGKHAAVTRGAEGVGVFEYIHAAVEPGAFAVPKTKHTVILRSGEQSNLLAAPY